MRSLPFPDIGVYASYKLNHRMRNRGNARQMTGNPRLRILETMRRRGFPTIPSCASSAAREGGRGEKNRAAVTRPSCAFPGRVFRRAGCALRTAPPARPQPAARARSPPRSAAGLLAEKNLARRDGQLAHVAARGVGHGAHDRGRRRVDDDLADGLGAEGARGLEARHELHARLGHV